MCKQEEIRDEIESLRTLTRGLSASVYDQSIKLAVSLQKYRGNTMEPVSWKEFIAFPMKEWLSLKDNIKFIRNETTDGTVEIDLLVKKNCSVGWHYHPDCTEHITVVQGSVLDAYNNMVLREGASHLYAPMTQHSLNALADAIIRIIVTKVEK
jgi:quercetin dioxygenase-like cupin family protein